MIVMVLVLAAVSSADTGEVLCKDWTVAPDQVVTHAGTMHNFRVKTLTECKDDLECVWSLTSEVGSLAEPDGLTIDWYAPDEYPTECEPLDTSLMASCTLWGSFTSTWSVDIQVRCTDAEWEQLALDRADLLSVQGGGCTSPRQAQALLLLLPVGLLGLRRRLSRP